MSVQPTTEQFACFAQTFAIALELVTLLSLAQPNRGWKRAN